MQDPPVGLWFAKFVHWIMFGWTRHGLASAGLSQLGWAWLSWASASSISVWQTLSQLGTVRFGLAATEQRILGPGHGGVVEQRQRARIYIYIYIHRAQHMLIGVRGVII